MRQTGRILATIAVVLSIMYLVYLYIVIYESSPDSAALPNQFTPHVISTGLALLMNGVGLVFNSRWFILTGALFYTIALILLPGNLLFVIMQAILLFTAFGLAKPARDQFI